MCSVHHEDVFSTLQGYRNSYGGYSVDVGNTMIRFGGRGYEYIDRWSVNWRNILNTSGNIEYIEGCSVHWGIS